MKNDHTYEYRVFTNRLVDVGPMEVGNCTSKVIENLKSKDKVDGRFFHTSDSNEWFFCWDGKLQKLNLSGDASVNEALKEVEKLIADATVAVEDAKKTAAEAKDAAASAKDAADAATSAVESIENKADQKEVDAITQTVESLEQEVSKKANRTAVESLGQEVSKKANQTAVDDLAQKVDSKASISDLNNKADKSDLKGLATEQWVTDQKYLTQHQDISGKEDKIDDLKEIRDGAAAGATALQSIPEEYVTETELIDKGYLTEQSLNGYATESFVSEEIKKIVIPDAPNMDDYYTKGDIDTMIGNINNMIGQATDITNRILNKQ